MKSNVSIKPYNEQSSKKEQVAQMFDNIAGQYDLLNRMLSLGIDRGWRKKAIRILAADQPSTILDLATGTGDMVIEIAKRLPNAHIQGVDLSSQMLKGAEKKVRKNNLSDRISLRQGDAENLAFDDNTHDAVTVAFGVRNFENLEKGLSEIYRTLKPGGRVIILEFSKPRHFPFAQLFQFYFKNILPSIGNFMSRDPRAYTYLYESVQSFPEGNQFIQILQKLGFKQSQCTSLTFGICSIYTAIKPS